MTVYTNIGDKIRGERIYAEFRNYIGPKEIEGTNINSITLHTTVQCWITKSFRKKR